MNKLEKIKQDMEKKYGDKTKDKTHFSVSLHADVYIKLKIYCESEGRLISWVVEDAIKEYFKKLKS